MTTRHNTESSRRAAGGRPHRLCSRCGRTPAPRPQEARAHAHGASGLLVISLVFFCATAGPLAGQEWNFDVVHLKNKQKFAGLILEESPDFVVMKSVTRRTGRPTLVNPVRLERQEVERIDRLDKEDRAQLERRLEALVREREFFMTQLRGLDPTASPELVQDAVKLHSVEWFQGEEPAFAYDSTYFRLLANTNDKVAQLAVIHLEQIYNAYIRAMPPRVKSGKVTTIVLPRDWADYQKVVFKLSNGRITNLATPAFYDVENNRIVCGSNLTQLIDDLEAIRTKHRELSRELDERLTQLRRIYKENIPRTLRAQLVAAQQKIRSTEADNLRTFAESQENLFRRLYHEAFHAYLANFVYPPGEGEVPRWLNEGLAQIFETAIVEVGELRANHASKERVHAIRGAIAADALVPVRELLQAGSEQFLALHDPRTRELPEDKRQMLERHYLGSWALAYYLFTHGIVGSPAMDEYVRALHQGRDPVDSFCRLVGKPLAQFEKDYLAFLNKLQPYDGPPCHPVIFRRWCFMADLIEPRTLRGFRDYLPELMIPREHLLEQARRVYRSYGFAPIDTPALEYAEILIGKGGDESDRLIYRFRDHGERDVAMRFDLTVPFARFAAMYVGKDIQTPFKRYHMGPVWRGENTGHGRYREFWQCDFDTIGTTSNAADVETALVIHDLMRAIGFERFEVRINNRLLLNGLLEEMGLLACATGCLRALDKLPKIGAEAVAAEMAQTTGATPEQSRQILTLAGMEGANTEILGRVEREFGTNARVAEGVGKLRQLLEVARQSGVAEERLRLDLSIARGLDYYTGTIYETFLLDKPDIGSVCSGGRYDNLAGLFTKRHLPGVGASLGLDRLLSAMEEMGLLPKVATPAPVLIVQFSEEYLGAYQKMARTLRAAGIGVEVYPEAKKLGQQFKYAEARGFAVALIAGPDELAQETWKIKNLAAREEVTVRQDEVVARVQQLIG